MGSANKPGREAQNLMNTINLPRGYGTNGKRSYGFCGRCGHYGSDCHCSVADYVKWLKVDESPIRTLDEANEEKSVLQAALALYVEHCEACARHTCSNPACEKATAETYTKRAAIARKLAEGFKA